MYKCLLFSLYFIFSVSSGIAQPDTLRQDTVRKSATAGAFNVSQIIDQIARYYKNEFEDYILVETKEHHHFVLDFGEYIEANGDSIVWPVKIVYIPYVKSDYFLRILMVTV
jgi:hypothetical protein